MTPTVANANDRRRVFTHFLEIICHQFLEHLASTYTSLATPSQSPLLAAHYLPNQARPDYPKLTPYIKT